jgi:hypothetical protein
MQRGVSSFTHVVYFVPQRATIASHVYIFVSAHVYKAQNKFSEIGALTD